MLVRRNLTRVLIKILIFKKQYNMRVNKEITCHAHERSLTYICYKSKRELVKRSMSLLGTLIMVGCVSMMPKAGINTAYIKGL